MRLTSKKLQRKLAILVVALIIFNNHGAVEANSLNQLGGISVGVAAVLETNLVDEKEISEKDSKDKDLEDKDLQDKDLKDKDRKDLDEKELKSKELKEKELKDKEEKELKEKEKQDSGLVMVNVNNTLNIRTDKDESSEIVGLMYKDCGGEILDQDEGWTKIQSGDLSGWAKDEYLLFGEEAEDLADEVGRSIATVNTDTLRIRKGPSQEAETYSLVALNENLDLVGEDGDWAIVNFEGNDGFLSKEYLDIEFKIDHGETTEAIDSRERKVIEDKAKLNVNYEAVPVGATDVELLAALIQCEAGGESYEGQLAVGAVVMNRVRSAGYPNTVEGVIFASGQFTPAMSGKVGARIAQGSSPTAIQAATEAINGVSNVGATTRFRRNDGRAGHVIGNHVFW